jgi:glycosyltransferase involved in cell wall biosynthesis
MENNISILLPVKNGSKFINESLEKLTKACRLNDEILVIDDFSEDNTKKNVLETLERDSRIRIIDNNSPGIVGALNLGIIESKNNWIARVDVDDNYELE